MLPVDTPIRMRRPGGRINGDKINGEIQHQHNKSVSFRFMRDSGAGFSAASIAHYPSLPSILHRDALEFPRDVSDLKSGADCAIFMCIYVEWESNKQRL